MATGGTALGFLAARVPQGSPQRGFFGNKRQLWRDPWCPLVAISCSWRFPARVKAWRKQPWKAHSNFRDAAAAAVVVGLCPGLPGSSPPESQIHSDCCPFTNQQARYCSGPANCLPLWDLQSWPLIHITGFLSWSHFLLSCFLQTSLEVAVWAVCLLVFSSSVCVPMTQAHRNWGVWVQRQVDPWNSLTIHASWIHELQAQWFTKVLIIYPLNSVVKTARSFLGRNWHFYYLLCGSKNWTQGLAHARQACLHWAFGVLK